MKDVSIDVSGTTKKKKKKKNRSVDAPIKKKKKVAATTGMHVAKDDYVIVEHQGKNFLALAFNPERNRAVIDSSLKSDESITVEYDEKTLLAVLGKKPRLGQTAFGVKIQPFVGSTESEHGDIHYFRELSELEHKAFNSALKRCAKRLREARLDVLPVGHFNILPKKGKYAGMYHYRKKGEVITDHIDLHPESFEDRKYNEYLLMHEYGHAVWYRLMSSSQKAKWISLYHKRLDIANIARERLDSMLQELLHFSGTLKDFVKEMPEDERPIFREVMNHYKRYHKLDSYALEIIHVENTEQFAKLWPKRTTIIENVTEDPSAYAMTKVEELWAECFAYHTTGKLLSKDTRKLMEQTLKGL